MGQKCRLEEWFRKINYRNKFEGLALKDWLDVWVRGISELINLLIVQEYLLNQHRVVPWST